MTEKLSVAVGGIGRFHTFDLAWQLQKRGHLAAVYSGYPRRNFRDTQVDPRLMRCFPWIQTPVELANRYGLMPRRLYRPLSLWAHRSLARHAARTLPRCHALSMLSSSGLEAGRAAQARNIAYVCDRGSTHIVWQREILSGEYERHGFRFTDIPPAVCEREIAEYETADAITVPSSFVRRTFVERGVPAERLHRIPYGVDLGLFAPRSSRDEEFRVLFVGGLSVRKGLPYLLQGFARAGIAGARLVLVGAPQSETETLLARHPVAALERTGPVPRTEVARQMARASVLVLPSVEEGLALVQAQALACGCPVIATPNTGAEDLFADGVEGFIVPARDPEAIADRLVRLHDDPALRSAMSEAALARVQAIGGWDSYGRAQIALFAALARARGHGIAPDYPEASADPP